MKNLRKIDFEKEKSFECGGRKFFVTDSPSFIRYREMQKIMIEFGFSASFEDIFNNLAKAIEFYNKQDFFQMSIIIYKIQEGIKNLETKDDPALRLCALFINEENEDTTKFNEAEMQSKIDCWASELEVFPFFCFANDIVPRWMPAYQLVIQSGLTPSPKKSES